MSLKNIIIYILISNKKKLVIFFLQGMHVTATLSSYKSKAFHDILESDEISNPETNHIAKHFPFLVYLIYTVIFKEIRIGISIVDMTGDLLKKRSK